MMKYIPSLLTLGNLSCGFAAVLFATRGQIYDSAILIFWSVIFDSLDGFAARKLDAVSMFGKELDSLADIVSFGVAPATLAYTMVLSQIPHIGMVIALMFPICGALRLARFNTQTEDLQYFIGLPITAAGGILTIALIFNRFIFNGVIVALCLALSLLMVSRVKFHHAKEKI